MATTVMQTEIPRQMRRIQDLRRRTRSKYPRICTLSARSAELVKTGCSFKTFLQVLPRPVHKFQTTCIKQALFHYGERHPAERTMYLVHSSGVIDCRTALCALLGPDLCVAGQSRILNVPPSIAISPASVPFPVTFLCK